MSGCHAVERMSCINVQPRYLLSCKTWRKKKLLLHVIVSAHRLNKAVESAAPTGALARSGDELMMTSWTELPRHPKFTH